MYRPGYGHLAAALGPCWQSHDLCLYGLDILSGLWSVLYLQPRRTPGLLTAQAEYQSRILPALADQLRLETSRCGHPRHPGRSPRPGRPGPPRPAVRARRRQGGRPVTLPGQPPDEPTARRQPDGSQVAPELAEDKDMRELQDPCDLPFPDDSARWPPGRPEYAIVVDQLRGWQPGGPSSLAEVLETGRIRQPEPDLEAEP